MTATLPDAFVDIDMTLDVPCTTIRCDVPATVMVTFGCSPHHQAPYCGMHLARIQKNSEDPIVCQSVVCEPHDDRAPYPIAGWRKL